MSSALDRLRALTSLARPEDIQRLKKRAETVEQLLREIAETLKRIEKCVCPKTG